MRNDGLTGDYMKCDGCYGIFAKTGIMLRLGLRGGHGLVDAGSCQTSDTPAQPLNLLFTIMGV